MFSLHHLTPSSWYTNFDFEFSAPQISLFLVHKFHFRILCTTKLALPSALIPLSNSLHHSPAYSWCTILVFALSAPFTCLFLVHNSCFRSLYTTRPLFPGVQFLVLLSLHHSPAYSWCTILVFSFSTPLARFSLVHSSCFCFLYTSLPLIPGVQFLFSCSLHHSHKSFTILGANTCSSTVSTLQNFLYYKQIPPLHSIHFPNFSVLQAKYLLCTVSNLQTLLYYKQISPLHSFHSTKFTVLQAKPSSAQFPLYKIYCTTSKILLCTVSTPQNLLYYK